MRVCVCVCVCVCVYYALLNPNQLKLHQRLSSGMLFRYDAMSRIAHADSWLIALQIENQAYPVNVDALHTVFTPYGFVQKIACFEKNNTWQVSASCDKRPTRHCLTLCLEQAAAYTVFYTLFARRCINYINVQVHQAFAGDRINNIKQYAAKAFYAFCLAMHHTHLVLSHVYCKGV